MVPNLDEFSKLTTLMFAASLDPNKWSDFLEYLAELTGVRAHMFGHDLESNSSVSMLSSNYDPEFISSYDEYYAEKNLWVPGFFAHQIGKTISSEAMCSRYELEKSEFYNDWVLPQEDVLAGGGAILFKEDTRMFVIGGNLRRKDEHLEKDWLQTVSLIMPHLQNAIEINRVLAREKLSSAVQTKGMNTSGAAVFIVNNFGKVVLSNQMAQEMVTTGEVARTDFGTRLSFSESYANDAFKRVVHSLNLMNSDVSSSFDVMNQYGTSRYSCRTARFNPRDHDISPFGILFGMDQPCVLLTVSKVEKRKTTKSELISRFAITEMEAEVVLQLVRGSSPRDISDQREVSIYTVRNQIKSAMSKMDVHRQIDLAKLID